MLNYKERTTQRLSALTAMLRWMMVASVALIAVWSAKPPPEANAPLLGALILLSLYQTLLTFLEFAEFSSRGFTLFTFGGDVVLALSLFWAGGGLAGHFIWIGLLPAVTGVMRVGLKTGFALLVLFTVGQVGVLWEGGAPTLAMWANLGFITLILSLVTLGVDLLMSAARRALQHGLQTENRAEALRSQSLREHIRALYEMSTVALVTMDYEKVLEATLNFGLRSADPTRLTASDMVCAVLMFEGDELHVQSSRRFATNDARKTCAARAGVLAQVTQTGEPAVIANPSQDPELVQFIALHHCQSLMALPLRAGLETYGVILYAHPDPGFFDSDQRMLLTSVVNQALAALQNAQLYRRLRQEKERLVEVQEEANKKLARDLHDGPTQAVAALAMRANFVRRLMERDPKSASDELYKMEDLARRTTKEIRHMLFTLRPLILENQGLLAALKQLAEKVHDTHGQKVIVEAPAHADEELEKNQQGVLFYIVEEAVNNARKHAQAAHIWVRLKPQNDVMLVEIHDDGVGFNLGAVDANYDKRGSLGMVNMRERTEMLGGVVKIQAAEGKGTRITVSVPLTEDARERLRHI